MNKPKIFKLFTNTHMGLGHDGLSKIARKNKIKLEELDETDLILFLNTKLDKLKVLGAQGKVIGYYRSPDRRRIEPKALKYIPHTFGVNGFDYEAACALLIQEKLGGKFV